MFVKNFFLFFFLDPRLGFPLTLYTHCITSWSVCQGVFYIFFRFRLTTHRGVTPLGDCIHLPLTLQIITHPIVDCNRQNAQIAGFLFFVFCATFPLDKLLGPWYNGNSARAHSRPGRQMSIGNFAQKKSEGYPSLYFWIILSRLTHAHSDSQKATFSAWMTLSQPFIIIRE